MYGIFNIPESIDRNALFLNLVKNKEIKTINNEEVLIIKKERTLIIKTEFKTIEVLPFIDNTKGFGLNYMDKNFFIPINYEVNNIKQIKKLHQYFENVLIEQILSTIHSQL